MDCADVAVAWECCRVPSAASLACVIAAIESDFRSVGPRSLGVLASIKLGEEFVHFLTLYSVYHLFERIRSRLEKNLHQWGGEFQSETKFKVEHNFI